MKEKTRKISGVVCCRKKIQNPERMGKESFGTMFEEKSYGSDLSSHSFLLGMENVRIVPAINVFMKTSLEVREK